MPHISAVAESYLSVARPTERPKHCGLKTPGKRESLKAGTLRLRGKESPKRL